MHLCIIIVIFLVYFVVMVIAI